MKASFIGKAALAGLVALALFSCAKNEPEPEPAPQAEEAEDLLPPARVTAITHDDGYGMTICEIAYPSSGPDGQPVTLSGVITFGDEVDAHNPAQGIVLVNRSTAIAVLKLTTDQYPEIRFTHTFAGSGPYDLQETCRFLLQRGESTTPHTVIEALLAFNEFYHLGYTTADLFQESAMSDIEQYILSKDYSRSQVAEGIPAQPNQNLYKEDLLNPESEMFRRFMEAFGKESLCTGWKPRKHERIFLSSHPEDDVVPPSSTENLYRFMTEEQEMTNVEWYSSRGISPLIPETVARHVAAVADYFIKVMNILRSRYGIAWLPNFPGILQEASNPADQ